MAQITRAWAKTLNDYTLGKTAPPAMGNVWLALLQSDPGPDGSLAGEPSGNGYARLALTASMSATDLSTALSSNATYLQFAAASGSWGANALAFWAIVDSATVGAGTVRLYGALTPPMLVGAGDAPPFPEGSLSVGFSLND
jgi:hypothetical protein